MSGGWGWDSHVSGVDAGQDWADDDEETEESRDKGYRIVEVQSFT